MTGFTTCVFLSRNRVSPKEAFEGLELCERKLHAQFLEGWTGAIPSGYSVIHSQCDRQGFQHGERVGRNSCWNFVSRQEMERLPGGKMPAVHCACPRPVYAGTGSAYRKLSTRMTSLLSASTCVYRIVSLSGATANPGACLAGRSSRSNTRAVRWVLVLKKVIPGFAVVSR